MNNITIENLEMKWHLIVIIKLFYKKFEGYKHIWV